MSRLTLTCNGETKTIAEWAEIAGISRQLIYKRKRLGWTDQDAVFRNKRPRIPGGQESACGRKSWRDCLKCPFARCIQPNGNAIKGESWGYGDWRKK